MTMLDHSLTPQKICHSHISFVDELTIFRFIQKGSKVQPTLQNVLPHVACNYTFSPVSKSQKLTKCSINGDLQGLTRASGVPHSFHSVCDEGVVRERVYTHHKTHASRPSCLSSVAGFLSYFHLPHISRSAAARTKYLDKRETRCWQRDNGRKYDDITVCNGTLIRVEPNTFRWQVWSYKSQLSLLLFSL